MNDQRFLLLALALILIVAVAVALDAEHRVSGLAALVANLEYRVQKVEGNGSR